MNIIVKLYGVMIYWKYDGRMDLPMFRRHDTMATRTRKTTKAATEEIDVKRCECGCDVIVKKRFVQGHDSRLKSRLLTEFDGGSEEAGEVLVQRGWRTAEELVRRQTAREGTAKAKAEAAAQREAKKAEQAKAEPKPKRTTRSKAESASQAAA